MDGLQGLDDPEEDAWRAVLDSNAADMMMPSSGSASATAVYASASSSSSSSSAAAVDDHSASASASASTSHVPTRLTHLHLFEALKGSIASDVPHDDADGDDPHAHAHHRDDIVNQSSADYEDDVGGPSARMPLAPLSSLGLLIYSDSSSSSA